MDPFRDYFGRTRTVPLALANWPGLGLGLGPGPATCVCILASHTYAIYMALCYDDVLQQKFSLSIDLNLNFSPNCKKCAQSETSERERSQKKKEN